MPSSLPVSNFRKSGNHLFLAVKTQISTCDDSFGLTHHGGANQQNLSGDPSSPKPFDVLDSRFSNRSNTSKEKFVGDLRRPESGFRHSANSNSLLL